MEEQKKTYDKIVGFYDFAEEIVDAVEEEEKAEEMLKLAEPLIEQIEDSTEMLVEIFMAFVDSNSELPDYQKARAEKAFRKIYNAIDKFREEEKKLN